MINVLPNPNDLISKSIYTAWIVGLFVTMHTPELYCFVKALAAKTNLKAAFWVILIENYQPSFQYASNVLKGENCMSVPITWWIDIITWTKMK